MSDEATTGTGTGTGQAGKTAAEEKVASSRNELFAGVMAVAILIFYAFSVMAAWRATGQDAETWARILTLLGGIEAIAFAAAGWVFGSKVSRTTVAALEDKADTQEKDKKTAEANATALAKDLDYARSEATALAGAVDVPPQAIRTIRGSTGMLAEGEVPTVPALSALQERALRVLDLYGQPPK